MNKPARATRRVVDGVLLFDKPAGMTSNAALQTVRRLYGAAKAGHTGTLDPLATGLLPLCFGEATKFAGELLDADKSYRATIRLGIVTDTADAEGRVLAVRPVAVTPDRWRVTTAEFQGELEQLPPMHSALKHEGRPLYEYARAGVEIARATRRIRIHRLETLSLSAEEAVIDVDCSKGTYIRALARDIGERLGCGAHLVALRRTRIGALDVGGALTLEALETMSAVERDACLLPVDALLADVPVARLDERDGRRLGHGLGVPWNGRAGQRYRLYAADGRFLGVGELGRDGVLRPRRMMSAVRPDDHRLR